MTKHTQVRCKHSTCGLHFVILSWHPGRHTIETITCPECGKKDGLFITYTVEVAAPIFTVVPGDAPFGGIGDIRQLLSDAAQPKPGPVDRAHVVRLRKRYYNRYGNDGAGDPNDIVVIHGTISVPALDQRTAVVLVQAMLRGDGCRHLQTVDPRVIWDYGNYTDPDGLRAAGYEYADFTFELDE